MREPGRDTFFTCRSVSSNWSDLSYADDLAVVAKDKAELIEMMERLSEESAYFGLKINFTKTKIMPVGPYTKSFTESKMNVIRKQIKV